MIDAEEYVWQDSVPLASDAEALSATSVNRTAHALASQQNVLARRWRTVVLTSSGGSIGEVEAGPIWGISTIPSVAAYQIVPSAVFTHSSGMVVSMAPTLAHSGVAEYAIISTQSVFQITLPLSGTWTVSGLGGDTILFV